MAVVAVLAGGRSPEHDVSLQSATQVLRHMGQCWRPWPVLIDREGRWRPAQAPADDREVPTGFEWPRMSAMSAGAALDFLQHEAKVEVVFPVLHGPFGEDGSVQGMLELHDLPFVGSGCAASAVAMDKLRTRECLTYHGVRMPAAYTPEAPLATADSALVARQIEDAIGFPSFLKVDVSGSTIGVHRATSITDAGDFIEEHRRAGRRFLAEAPVVGEEITVPVLGNSGGPLQALTPVGIYPVGEEFFTYEAKYTARLCDEVAPPRGLSAADISTVQEIASRCHVALQCDGMSRTDMIMGPDGPVVLEVNTIPGLTELSLLPRAAAADGIEFSALIDRLLDLAMQRAGVTESSR